MRLNEAEGRLQQREEELQAAAVEVRGGGWAKGRGMGRGGRRRVPQGVPSHVKARPPLWKGRLFNCQLQCRPALRTLQ